MGTHWLEWTTRGADLFARPLNADVEIVWCWPGQYQVALKRDAEQRVLQAIQKEKAMRFWPMPNGEHLLLRQKEGFFNVPTSTFVLKFGICRDFFPADVLALSADELRQAVDKLEDTYELRFVRALMAQTREPRLWIDWVKGTGTEFESLALAAFVLTGVGEFRAEAAKPRQPLDLQECLRPFPEDENEVLIPFINVLSEFFEAQSSLHVRRLRNYRCQQCPAPLWAFDRRGDEPTQHERLEALLLWRDFLRGKMPDAETEALLRPVAG